MPVRCYTCGKVIGQYEQLWEEKVEEGCNLGDVLDGFGMSRICCRRMFLGHVNIIDQLLLIPKDIPSHSEKKAENP